MKNTRRWTAKQVEREELDLGGSERIAKLEKRTTAEGVERQTGREGSETNRSLEEKQTRMTAN